MQLISSKKGKGIAGATLALFTLLSMSGSYIRAGAAGNNINSHQEPPPATMLRLYRQVRLNGDLTKSNYFKKMQEAVDDLDGDVSDCLQTTSFVLYADHNGINNE